MDNLAFVWGFDHYCSDAELAWRHSLGPQATQADAWQYCHRSDWLLRQWGMLSLDLQILTYPAIEYTLEKMVSNVVELGLESLRGVRTKRATKWRHWAQRWLSREDRTLESARASIDNAWNMTPVIPVLRAANRAALLLTEWVSRTDHPSWLALTVAWEAGEGTAWSIEKDRNDPEKSDCWAVTRNTSWNKAFQDALLEQARYIQEEMPVWPKEDYSSKNEGLIVSGEEALETLKLTLEVINN